MALLNDEKLRMMEDEMNRFEAEIALPVLPPPPPPPSSAAPPSRPVIGSNTYNQVQRRLEEQQTGPPLPDYPPGPPMGFPPMAVPSFAAIPPPPPPPPPLLIPHQVQRGPPMRHPLRPMGPPGPPMMGRAPAHHGPPAAPGPPPPGFMGPHQMAPGPPYMGPPVAMEQPQPPPISSVPQAEVQAEIRATPKIYMAKSGIGDSGADIDDSPEKRRKRLKPDSPAELTRAKEMAERVRASMVVSVGPVSEETPSTGRKKEKKSKKHIRMAGGQVWEDNSLTDWDDDDFRIFCGDLGNDVTDEILTRAFSKFQSFQRAKVVRDKRTNKTKGFGFVSFTDPQDFIKAMKEMNGRYVGSRPIKLRKSSWKSRNIEVVKKKEKEKAALIGLLTGR